MTKYTKPLSGIDDLPLSAIIINNKWRTIFDGILNDLTKMENWLGSEIDAQNATQQVLEKLLWSDEIGGVETMLRQSVVNPLILEQSLDNGDNWQQAFDFGVLLQANRDTTYQKNELSLIYNEILEQYAYTIQSVAPKAIYGVSGVDGVNGDVWRDTALCVSLREIVNLCCEIEIERRKTVTVFASVVTGALAIASAVIATGIIVLSAGTLLPIALAVSSAIVGASASIFGVLSNAVLNNLQARDTVACCAYNALKGQNLTQANLLNSLNACGFVANSHEAQLSGAIQYVLGQDDVYVTLLYSIEKNFNFAKLGLSQCACNPVSANTVSFIWNYTNTATPLVPPQNWTFWSDRGLINVPVPYRGYGQYGVITASSYTSANLHFTMPLTTLRKLRLFGFANSSVSNTFRRVITRWYRGGLLLRNSSHALPARLNANQLVVMDSNHAVDRLEILIEAQQGFSGVCAYRIEMDSVI